MKRTEDQQLLAPSQSRPIPKGQRRRRWLGRGRNASEYFVNGDVVLVIEDGVIVTVLPKRWLA